jgi:hypothetical protein
LFTIPASAPSKVYIDEINGPSSQKKSVKISRHERRLIASHWLHRLEVLDFYRRTWGPDDEKQAPLRRYASGRVRAMVAARLVTDEEPRDLAADARDDVAEFDGPPEDDEAGPIPTPPSATPGVTVRIPITCARTGEPAGEATVDLEDRELAAHKPWHSDEVGAYTIVEVLGAKIHVYMHDLVGARRFGVPALTGGIMLERPDAPPAVES